MQLAHAILNTNNPVKNKPKTAKQLRLEVEHQAWLRKNGVHPDQLTNSKKHKIKVSVYKTDKNIKTSDKIVDGGRATGIMVNLHKESPEIQRAILEKASNCVPLYNKGGLQYCTPETDITKIGSLSRRG